MTININELRQSLGAVQPEEVSELLDRLEEAERERDTLKAKVDAMEKQEPVAEIVSFGGPDLKEVAWKKGKMPALGSKLYALPGAKGE